MKKQREVLAKLRKRIFLKIGKTQTPYVISLEPVFFCYKVG